MTSCSLFLYILLRSSLTVWPLPYIPYVTHTMHWALNKYLLPKSCYIYTTPMQSQVILSIITSPLWKKPHFFDHYFMLGKPETRKLGRSHKRKKCRGQNCKEGTGNTFAILWKVKNVFTASLKFFWHFLKLNLGGWVGKRFGEWERERKLEIIKASWLTPL